MNKTGNVILEALRGARRANHTGTIWQQAGIFYGKILFRGKLLRTKGYKTRVRAVNALNRLAAEIAKKMECKTTLSEWAEEWLKVCQHRVASNTYRNYSNAIGHVCRHVGHLRLSIITAHDLSMAYATLLEEGLSPTTIAHIASTTTLCARYAVKAKRIDTDFTIGAIKPKKEKRRYRIFTQQESENFMTQIKNERLRFPFLFMLLLGLRRGEALGIKWEDINFEKLTIKAHYQVVSESGAKVIKKPKTASSVRTLALPDLLARQLQEVPARQRKSYPYSFRLLRPDSMSRDFRRIMRGMGITGMRLHDLRHTFASQCVVDGVSLDNVAAQLGHASVKMVVETYSHRQPGVNRACSETIDKLYDQNSKPAKASDSQRVSSSRRQQAAKSRPAKGFDGVCKN